MIRWMAIAVVMASTTAHAEDCEQLARSFETDPQPMTEMAIGDCQQRQGQLEWAMRWFRDAERRFETAHDLADASAAHARAEALAGQLGTATHDEPLAEPAHAREWRMAMWASAGASALGIFTWIYGAHLEHDATDQLCAGGAYYGTMPNCPLPSRPLTLQQVQQLNDQGRHGETLTWIGAGVTLAATTVAVVALYEGYVKRPTPRDHFAILPAVSGDGAGALVRVRW
jgi:hypothetical protein